MRNKLLIIEKLNACNVLIVLILSIFGYECKYLYISSLFNIELFKNILNKFFITHIDLSTTKNYNPHLYHGTLHELSKKIYDNISLKNYKTIKKIFKNHNIAEDKIANLLVYSFYRLLKDNDLIVYTAKILSPEYNKIAILNSTSVMLYSLLNKSYIREKNCKIIFSRLKFFNPMIIIISIFSKIFTRVFFLILQKLKTVRRNLLIDNHKKDEKENIIRNAKILYFPHMGAYYGKLYKKNFLYSDDPKSLFYEKNIMHIEYHLGIDRDNIEKHYIENNIPYFIIGSFSVSDLKMSIKSILKQPRLLFLLLTNNIAILAGIFIGLLDFNRYKRYLSRFKSAKLAYSGYDALFPLPCSLALSALNVKTATHQERFNLLYLPNYQNICFDYYYTWGERAITQIKKDFFGQLTHVEPLGLIRLDVLKQHYKNRNKLKLEILTSYKLSRQYDKVITCYDYHSDPYNSQNHNPEFNWRNNTVFYKDIITLSEKYPNYIFIIRGKTDDWCSIDYFKIIKEKMDKIDNIIIDREYEKSERSYDLAVISDLILAKYTSIGDECLALGIPVIFHDYAVNHNNNFSSFYDYEGYPVFVHNFVELDKRISSYIQEEKVLSEKELTQLRKCMYNDSHKYIVKVRLHEHLKSLL